MPTYPAPTATPNRAAVTPAGVRPMFQRAVKFEARLRLAIAGPSGSGKTYTSLAIATALGGRIALVDTEHGSASKYADLFDFDVLNLDAPFHPDRFVEAIRAAQAAGYQVLILDSLSHAWSGPGGVLEIKEQMAKRREYNDYTAWGPAGELQNRLVQAILRSDLHVIATMRSKTSYAMDEVIEDGRKRTKVVKQGMAPIQRDGFEYEFDVFIDMDIDNNAIVTKTRCPALTGKVFPRPGADVAEILATWLKGQPAPEPPPTDPSGQGHDPGGNGAGGGGSNGHTSVGNGTAPADPQAEAGRRLRARLETMGIDMSGSTTVTAALANVDQPWAKQAVGLIKQKDWAGLLQLELA
ncbi:MAG: ATP-binding protein [Anaerolineae bacterium]